MKFTKEKTEDGIKYVLEIEFYSDHKTHVMTSLSVHDDDYPDDDTYTVEMSEATVQGLKKLQGAAELDEVASIRLQFRDIRPDVHHIEPVEISSIHLDDLINSINIVTSGVLGDRFKGIEFPYDQTAPVLILKK